MELTKHQTALYEKARETLLFDDLYDFILSLWPEEIDVSQRGDINYGELTGLIHGLSQYCDKNEEILRKLDISLLIHLNWIMCGAVHKNAIISNTVRPKEINREYVRYRFENHSINCALEKNLKTIPNEERDDIDEVYGIELVKEYFARNKRS